METHIERAWDGQRTRCGLWIWLGSPDVVRRFIPADKIKPTRRGATCKNCRRSAC